MHLVLRIETAYEQFEFSILQSRRNALAILNMILSCATQSPLFRVHTIFLSDTIKGHYATNQSVESLEKIFYG